MFLSPFFKEITDENRPRQTLLTAHEALLLLHDEECESSDIFLVPPQVSKVT